MSELDRTNYPAFLQTVRQAALVLEGPRSYPGYPKVTLAQGERKWIPQSLESALLKRRRNDHLTEEIPSAKSLGHILRHAHGVCAQEGRGPTPSAGGLQALELYFLCFGRGWLPAGGYHYDRSGHLLTKQFQGVKRNQIEQNWIPSLATVEGGSLAWVLVGDALRVEKKYSHRAAQFLTLEAGHLMQNLCLLSPTIPLGGFFEKALARAFQLPRTDLVLYAGLL